MKILLNKAVAEVLLEKFRKISVDFRGCGQMKILGHEVKVCEGNVVTGSGDAYVVTRTASD